MPDIPDKPIGNHRPDFPLELHNFWPKVNKDGPIPKHKPELGPCWLWTGKKRPNGYGIAWNNALHREIRAHRASFIMEFGHTDLDVCHHCDNPLCVRPTHLFAGTVQDNLRDMHAKGRQFTKLTESQVLEILKLRAEGMTQQKLADLFHVGQAAISRICRRVHWKHLKDEVEPPK